MANKIVHSHWRNESVLPSRRLSSRRLVLSVLALSLSKCRRVPTGRRRIYCSIGSSPSGFHVSIPERQHVSLKRATDAAGDASTPIRMKCVTTNTNRWQPGLRYPGQTRTKPPIEAAFRTSSLRIPRFLDSSEAVQQTNEQIYRVRFNSSRREYRDGNT